jgi:hypothetical protein
MQKIDCIGFEITVSPMANKCAGLVEEDSSAACKAVRS